METKCLKQKQKENKLMCASRTDRYGPLAITNENYQDMELRNVKTLVVFLF